MGSGQTVWGQLAHLVGTYGSQYVDGYGVTLRIGVIAFVGGLLLGLALTVLRISQIPPLRAAVSAYVELFRNIPVLCLLIFVVFALPEVGVVIDYQHAGSRAGRHAFSLAPPRPPGRAVMQPETK